MLLYAKFIRSLEGHCLSVSKYSEDRELQICLSLLFVYMITENHEYKIQNLLVSIKRWIITHNRSDKECPFWRCFSLNVEREKTTTTFFFLTQHDGYTFLSSDSGKRKIQRAFTSNRKKYPGCSLVAHSWIQRNLYGKAGLWNSLITLLRLLLRPQLDDIMQMIHFAGSLNSDLEH